MIGLKLRKVNIIFEKKNNNNFYKINKTPFHQLHRITKKTRLCIK